MQQYDKNSLIGFILMAIILIVFNMFFFSGDNKNNIEQENVKHVINNEQVNYQEILEEDNVLRSTSNTSDTSLNLIPTKEEHYILENEKLKLTFSNKGGRIISAILKDYKTYDGNELKLFDADSSISNLTSLKLTSIIH